MERKIATLFKELCCSVCKADFNEASVTIMRKETTPQEEMIIFKLSCPKCGKSFGVSFLGISDFELKNYSEDDLVLKVQKGVDPISEDDVLNAHKFIKELDKDWQKFISGFNDN